MSINVTSNQDSTVEQRINKIVAEYLGVAKADIKPESKIVDDLGADSLDTVEMVMALEDEFEIEIADEISEQWVTVGDALNYITEKAKL